VNGQWQLRDAMPTHAHCISTSIGATDMSARVRAALFAPVPLVLVFALLAARVAWIAAVPDIDMDAYGHYGIGCELIRNPWNLAAHWVWLPLYHYLLAAVVLARGVFAHVRLLSAALIGALPLVLYRYEMSRDARNERVAPLAAVCCALASIVNVLGISAQQEALFSMLVLLSAWAIDAERPVLSGWSLALACLIRYEAWGAAGVCLAQPILVHALVRLERAPREGTWAHVLFGRPLSFAVSLPAIAVMLGWVLVHRAVDGTWFAFLRALYEYTHAQREVLSHGAVVDLLWFPLLLPLFAFGPALLVVPFGVRTALRPGYIVPLGILAFLLLSYAGKGSLGGSRYYGAITPFLCACMAHGVLRLVRGEAARTLLRASVIASLSVTTAIAFVRLEKTASAQAEVLHAAERRMVCERDTVSSR